MTQGNIRRTQDTDGRGIRAGTFVPRMVQIFNDLDPEYKSLPMSARGATDVERFQMLKEKLRDKSQWDALGYPGNWPACKEDAMLDRADEIYGLGIDSDTTSEEEEEETT